MKSDAYRRNLLFFGIKEEKSENRRFVIKRFLTNNLKLKNPNPQTETIQRIGTIRANSNRPILVKYLSMEDRNLARPAAPILSRTNYSIAEH